MELIILLIPVLIVIFGANFGGCPYHQGKRSCIKKLSERLEEKGLICEKYEVGRQQQQKGRQEIVNNKIIGAGAAAQIKRILSTKPPFVNIETDVIIVDGKEIESVELIVQEWLSWWKPLLILLEPPHSSPIEDIRNNNERANIVLLATNDTSCRLVHLDTLVSKLKNIVNSGNKKHIIVRREAQSNNTSANNSVAGDLSTHKVDVSNVLPSSILTPVSYISMAKLTRLSESAMLSSNASDSTSKLSSSNDIASQIFNNSALTAKLIRSSEIAAVSSNASASMAKIPNSRGTFYSKLSGTPAASTSQLLFTSLIHNMAASTSIVMTTRRHSLSSSTTSLALQSTNVNPPAISSVPLVTTQLTGDLSSFKILASSHSDKMQTQGLKTVPSHISLDTSGVIYQVVSRNISTATIFSVPVIASSSIFKSFFKTSIGSQIILSPSKSDSKMSSLTVPQTNVPPIESSISSLSKAGVNTSDLTLAPQTNIHTVSKASGNTSILSAAPETNIPAVSPSSSSISKIGGNTSVLSVAPQTNIPTVSKIGGITSVLTIASQTNISTVSKIGGISSVLTAVSQTNIPTFSSSSSSVLKTEANTSVVALPLPVTTTSVQFETVAASIRSTYMSRGYVSEQTSAFVQPSPSSTVSPPLVPLSHSPSSSPSSPSQTNISTVSSSSYSVLKIEANTSVVSLPLSVITTSVQFETIAASIRSSYMSRGYVSVQTSALVQPSASNTVSPLVPLSYSPSSSPSSILVSMTSAIPPTQPPVKIIMYITIGCAVGVLLLFIICLVFIIIARRRRYNNLLTNYNVNEKKDMELHQFKGITRPNIKTMYGHRPVSFEGSPYYEDEPLDEIDISNQYVIESSNPQFGSVQDISGSINNLMDDQKLPLNGNGNKLPLNGNGNNGRDAHENSALTSNVESKTHL